MLRMNTFNNNQKFLPGVKLNNDTSIGLSKLNNDTSIGLSKLNNDTSIGLSKWNSASRLQLCIDNRHKSQIRKFFRFNWKPN